jgi:hypothetical protein
MVGRVVLVVVVLGLVLGVGSRRRVEREEDEHERRLLLDADRVTSARSSVGVSLAISRYS